MRSIVTGAAAAAVAAFFRLSLVRFRFMNLDLIGNNAIIYNRLSTLKLRTESIRYRHGTCSHREWRKIYCAQPVKLIINENHRKNMDSECRTQVLTKLATSK